MKRVRVAKKHALPIALVIMCAALFSYKIYEYAKMDALKSADAPEAVTLENLKNLETVKKTGESDEDPKIKPRPTESETAPEELNIYIPFYSQAPYANWDYPWQEACEEASVILVANAFNSMELNREDYNTELLRLVEWEKAYFGSYEHTTIEQTKEMIQIQYGLATEIHENPTFEDIKKIIADGDLIIAPFAGKLLGNPNFRNGGPNYHMLVIKGYNESEMQIVTHDVGTRNGEDYVYDWSIMENALHDWHDMDITQGAKKIIEIFPQQ